MPVELSKTDARRTQVEIHKALKAGHKPPGAGTGTHEKSAIRVVADLFGCTSSVIQNRIRPGGPCEKWGFLIDWSLYRPKPEPERPAPVPVERNPAKLFGDPDAMRLLALEEEVSDLRKRLREAGKMALDDEAIRQILGGISDAPIEPPKWILNVEKNGRSAHVPMTIWSDWHGGEVVSRLETNGINEFDLEIFERRVKQLVEKTIHLCREYGPGNYPGIVINLLGDFISGGLHPELAKSDEEEVLPAVLRVRDLLIAALSAMADEFGAVYCPCAAGNHGRATHKPEFKRYFAKNFDWLIYQLLARHFVKDKRLHFNIPESNEIHYQVFGLKFLAMHGDMLGVKGGDGLIGLLGPVSRGEFKVGRQSSSIGRPFDVLLMGHWHTALWLPRAIVAGTLKGFDEYAKNALRAAPAPPSQPLWFVAKQWGIVSRMEVYVDDPTLPQSARWVAWQEDAA